MSVLNNCGERVQVPWHPHSRGLRIDFSSNTNTAVNLLGSGQTMAKQVEQPPLLLPSDECVYTLPPRTNQEDHESNTQVAGP